MIVGIPALMEETGARVMGDYVRMTFDGVEYRVYARAYQPSKSWRYRYKLYEGNDISLAIKAFSDYELLMQSRKEHDKI
jgi:hypothetical protein